MSELPMYAAALQKNETQRLQERIDELESHIAAIESQNQRFADDLQALHGAQLAAPVLTECRHCGFRVALNEAPQGEGK